MVKPSHGTVFTERLNHLRYRFRPVGREEPLSAKEISDGVLACTGQTMSESSIRYLINGDRQPKLETAKLLAEFFGVTTAYFTDNDVAAVDADLDSLELLRALKQANVTAIAARLSEVSDVELRAFAEFIGHEVNRRADAEG